LHSHIFGMNPHLQQSVQTSGAPLETCSAAAILLHGRGRSPEEMIALAERFAVPGVAYLAPAAEGASWYPYSFLEPQETNQPRLSYALEVCQHHILLLHARGLPLKKIALIGFSQGACLAAEYVWRNPAPYGGVMLFTGGLHGPPGTTWPRQVGDFARTPLLISGADEDSWVPAVRMRESAEAFRRMGAAVQLQLYPGDSHIVSDAEIDAARNILMQIGGGDR
jgi:phospholipase/carboxylesterase